MNGVYIRSLSDDELAQRAAPFLERTPRRQVDPDLLRRVVPLIRERIKLLTEAEEMAGFFFEEGELGYDTETLLGKKFADERGAASNALETVLLRIRNLQPWDHETLEGAIRPLAEELALKTGELFGLIRVAVTGRTAAPPLFETMAVLGRERTLERVESAIGRLADQAASEGT